MKRRCWILFLCVPWLAGCIEDAASWHVDSRDHALSLFRVQRWFWRDNVELELVVARMPDCQRRHHLQPVKAAEAMVDVYALGPNDFVVRQGTTYYVVESVRCTGFQKFDSVPPGGIGEKVGSFRELDGKFGFIPEAKR